MNVRMVTVSCAGGCGRAGDVLLADTDDGLWTVAPLGWFRREPRVNHGEIMACSRSCLIGAVDRTARANELFTGRRRIT